MYNRAYSLAGVAVVLLVVATCSGCSTIKTVAMTPDWTQSVRNGELTFNYPKGKLRDHGAFWYQIPGDDQWRRMGK